MLSVYFGATSNLNSKTSCLRLPFALADGYGRQPAELCPPSMHHPSCDSQGIIIRSRIRAENRSSFDLAPETASGRRITHWVCRKTHVCPSVTERLQALQQNPTRLTCNATTDTADMTSMHCCLCTCMSV